MTDVRMECMVLGGMLHNPAFCDIGMEKLKAEDFFFDELQDAFETISNIWSKEGKVDLLSFVQVYKENDLFSLTKATEYCQFVFLENDFIKSLERVIELRKCREVAKQAQNARDLAVEGNLKEALKVGSDAFFGEEETDDSLKFISPAEHAEKMEKMIVNPEKAIRKGYFTKYQELNSKINGGFSSGDLIILSAPTGHGKTLLSMNLMESFAMVQKVPTLYINTEMSEEQINARWITILSNRAGVNYQKVITGTLDGAGPEIALKATKKLKDSTFCSVEAPNLDMKTAELILRRYKAKMGIKIAFLDYVGRMETQDPKQQEWQVLVRIAKKLKTLAQKLDMTIFMVAQQTGDGNLQGSKAMENEATVFLVLDRPKETKANLDPTRKIQQKLSKYRELGADGAIIISKNRVGPEGRILVKFDENTLRFEEVRA